MTRSAFSPVLLSAVVEAGDALNASGVDFRSAFITSALSYDAARHASPSVPSSVIVTANKERVAVAGVPRYVSPTSVDCHALTGAALSHGYDDETDPFAMQSAVIDAVSVVGMKTARKILRAEHASADDAVSALLDAVEAYEPPAVETTDETTGEDETGEETGEETATVSRITAGLALILDALNDGEEMTDDETATFLAVFEAATITSALAAV